MRSTRVKNFLREIKNNKGRFLSIFFIVLLGTAFFSGIRSTSGAMKYVADKYYKEAALMDIRVISTLGMTDKDIEDLSGDPDVEVVEGGHTADMLVQHGQELKVIKVIAETEKTNQPDLLQGNLPKEKNECIADFAIADQLGYHIGDTIKLRSGTSDDISDTLNTTEFKITGIGNLPYYVDLTRGASSIGDGEIVGFILVSPEVFEQDFYTEGYIKLYGTDGLYAFSDEYQETVEASEDGLEEIMEAGAARRYTEVINDAREEIEEHKQEIADGERELIDAKKELDDGKKELDDAKKEIDDGKKELDDAKKELDDGRKELVDAKKKLDDGEKELADAKKEIDDGERELIAAKRQVDAGEQELINAKQQVDAGERELADAKQQVDAGEQELIDAKKKLDDGKNELDDAKKQIDDGKSQIAAAEAQLAESEAELAKGWEQYYSGKEQLEAGRKELEAAWQQYYDGQAQLEEQEQLLDAGKKELEAGYAQYEENYAAFAEKKAEYEAGEAQYAELEEMLAEDPDNIILWIQVTTLRAILDEMEPQIEEAEQQLAEAKQVLDAKSAELAAAEALLNEAKAEAAKGYETLSAKQAEFDASEAQLEAARQELQAGQTALDQGKKELKSKKKELEAAEEQYLEGLAQWESGKEEYEAGYAKWESGKEEYEAGYAKWESGKREYEAGYSRWASGKREYENGLAKWYDGKRKYEDGLKELQDGKKEYEDGLKEWKDGKKKYEDGLAEWEEGVLEYEDGLKEWEDGFKEYNDNYDDAIEEIEDGKQKLADAEKELDELAYPDIYVLNRDKVESLVSFGGDADRLDKLSDVFPVIFFLVAALVSLTAMTRMIEEQRLEIGTFKALGASDFSIAMKYILYASIASVGGGIIGVFVGESVLPYVILDAYKTLYVGIPVGYYPFNSLWAVIAVLVATGCTVGATYLACRRALSDRPAVLMRPEAPKNGSRVLFERFPKLWGRLNFSKKATIRNLFRYKKRFFMTIAGIGGCMALMLVGYGIRDSIQGIAQMQYTEIFRQDATVTINDQASEEEIKELRETIANYDGIQESIDIDLIAVTLKANDAERDAYLYIPKEPEEAAEYVRLKDRTRDLYYPIPDEGALITEKTADMLGVKAGDTIEIDRNDDSEPASVVINNIVENYVLHYLYLSPDTYRDIFGEEPEFNEILIKYENDEEDPAFEKALGETLLASDACSSVEFITDLRQRINDMLDTLGAIMWVLILCSALLAFVVLFNLNSINMTERKRELATLKVLGFHDMEVAMYIYRENIILTAVGIVIGIFLGIILHRFIITTVEVNLMMFGRTISVGSFVICALWTLLFSIGVNLIMYYHFKKIDMIESLKSVE